jgi:hypothetical protein
VRTFVTAVLLFVGSSTPKYLAAFQAQNWGTPIPLIGPEHPPEGVPQRHKAEARNDVQPFVSFFNSKTVGSRCSYRHLDRDGQAALKRAQVSRFAPRNQITGNAEIGLKQSVKNRRLALLKGITGAIYVLLRLQELNEGTAQVGVSARRRNHAPYRA